MTGLSTRLLLCPALLAFALPAAALGLERATNGGFETGLLGFEAHVDATVVAEEPHGGAHCLRVEGNAERNCFAQQSIAVLGGREYDFSVWIRSRDVPAGADCKAYWNTYRGEELLETTVPLPRIEGTTEWTRQRTRFTAPEEATRIGIILQLSRSTGTVWFDDLSLMLVPTEAERTRVAAQATELARTVELCRAAPEVAPGVHFAATPDGLILCNERLALAFGGPEEAFGLRSLVDLEANRAFVVPGYDTDLWRVELRPATEYVYGGAVVTASATPASGCSHELEVRDDAAVLRLAWRGAMVEGAPALDAEATVTLRAGDLARWRLKATSRDPLEAIWLVDFPRIPGLGASGEGAVETEYLAIPMQQGWRWRDPRQTVDWGEGWADYPGGGKSMQFEAYCVPDGIPGGLYFGTEDPGCCRKTSICKARGDAFSYTLRNYPANMGRVGDYEMPYPAVVGAFSGDWWDAAQIYRRWALQQPWSSAGPVRDRASTPQWLKDIGIWVQGDVPGDDAAAMEAQVKRVTHFQEEMGAPLAFHAYLWQHAPAHDTEYPFFMPPKPSSLEFVRRLKEAGVRVVPYLNIYSADGAGSRYAPERLADLVMHTASGEPYADPTGLQPMCPATVRWRQLLAPEFRGVLEALPVDGLYLDQLTGAAYMCFDPDHGHPVGGGDHFHQGLRALCAEARAALAERCPDGMTFGENTSEGCNDLVDAQLPWAELYPDRNLPLFEAVYADHMIRFGLFIGRPDLWGDSSGYYSKLAWTFVIGQQPGWLMLGILNEFDNPEYAAQRAVLKGLVACRLAALDFLQYGQFLRPLDLPLEPREVAWDDWSRPRTGALPPVLNGVWRAPDARVGVALANWTAEEQTVQFPVAAEWGLGEALKSRVCLSGEWGEPSPVPEVGLALRVPARATMVVEVRGE